MFIQGIMNLFTPPLALGLVGNRGAGKDTLASIFLSINPHVLTYSFAAALREDLSRFIRLHYGIDVWTTNPKEKELIRPFLLAHGCGMRALDPNHWVNRVHVSIQNIQYADDGQDKRIIPVITDVRFLNEATHFKTIWGDRFRLVNVVRDGAPEPTDEEKRNYPAVAALCDHTLHWGNDTPARQRERAIEVAQWVGMKIYTS